MLVRFTTPPDATVGLAAVPPFTVSVPLFAVSVTDVPDTVEAPLLLAINRSPALLIDTVPLVCAAVTVSGPPTLLTAIPVGPFLPATADNVLVCVFRKKIPPLPPGPPPLLRFTAGAITSGAPVLPDNNTMLVAAVKFAVVPACTE